MTKLMRVLSVVVLAILLILGQRVALSLSAPGKPFEQYAEPVEFMLDLPASMTTTADSPPSGWQLLNQQDFPNNSSLPPWESVNNQTGSDQWGIGEIGAENWGVWVRGGAAQVSFNSGEVYTDGMDTWLVYGPIASSEQVYELKLLFDYFISLRENDYFIAGYSTDGTNFEGLRVTSLQMTPPAWAGAELRWPVREGASQLWVAFGFTSNEDGQVSTGVWLDHLELFANYGSKVYLPLVLNNWSPVVEIPGFLDDFSDSASGWPRCYYDRESDEGHFMDLNYVDETYRMKVLLDANGKNNKTMGFVKSPYTNVYTSYNLTVDQYFARAADQVVDPVDGKSGLIFGANDDFSTVYVLEWNFQGHCAVTRYDDVPYPVSGYGDPLKETPLVGWHACQGLSSESYGVDHTNHLRVEVRDNVATLYIVDEGTKRQVTQLTSDYFRNHHGVGLLTGAFEWTPVEARFDNFYLEPVE
ncbi:MAG: DUF1349 domain-containing protein [Anaerolineae bacterium]|nr:DUF1349 domain-containing protein [Anaerolineae bacterium]